MRVVLERLYSVCERRNFRVILVEDFDDYKVFIQIPDGKSRCDFYVWRVVYKDGKLVDLKVPAHDDLGNFYLTLRKKHKLLDEFLINAVMRLIRDRWTVGKVIEQYFHELNVILKAEVKRFLATLKWIAVQKDPNYPPKERRLDSKYTFAVYTLLEAGFTMSELRRVLRF